MEHIANKANLLYERRQCMEGGASMPGHATLISSPLIDRTCEKKNGRRPYGLSLSAPALVSKDLSKKAQELAGSDDKGQRMAQLALQHQGKYQEAN
ncbi:MAG: hypothetical protein FRX49_09591 [Trebouxia sp. A1-2]|nr:MAG: hypothetical protein FRX49_09591 [Trebouxia sp. A1-2]